MGLFDLDEAVSNMALESIGFTGANITELHDELESCHSSSVHGDTLANITEVLEPATVVDLNGTITSCHTSSVYADQLINSTAVDQMRLCMGVTPDLVNSTWINEMYQIVASFAMDMFWIFFIAALIGYILKKMDKLSASQEADMMYIIKRSLIASFMIYNGIPVIMMLLLTNQYISEIFGGDISVLSLLVSTLVSPTGAFMKVGCVLAIIWNAIFYLIRLIIIYISCPVWAIAWVLWVWDRTATLGVFLLTIIVINIFLGAAMTLVYWVGACCIIGGGTLELTSWGGDIMGLIIMIIAGLVPIIAFFFVIFNPTALVKKTVFIAAKLV